MIARVRRGTRSSVGIVTAATIAVAASGYIVILIAARALGPDGYYVFSVFWGALYLGVGAIFGVQQEATRAVSLRTIRGVRPDERSSRILAPGLLIGLIVGIGVFATSPIWASDVFIEHPIALASIVAVASLAYSGQAAMAGALAGLALWRPYGGLLLAEALTRLALVAAAALLVPTVAGFAVAVGGGMLVWLAFLSVAAFRRAALQPVAGSTVSEMARMGQSLGASASSALIVTGFPVLVALTARDSDAPSSLSTAILVVMITRAPIMVPLNAFLGMIVGAFVRRRDSGVLGLFRTAGAIAGASVILGILAALFGAQLITLFFGEGFATHPLFVGAATFAAGLLGIVTVSGAAALARNRHLVYLFGWLAAALATCVALLLPFAVETRAVVALISGPLVGYAIHVIGLSVRND